MKKIIFFILVLLVPMICYSLVVKEVQEVSALTGENSINKTDLAGVRGTDLGIPIEYKKWIFYFFGDTYFTKDIKDPKAKWRSNVLAYTSDFDASDGILLDGWMRDDYAFAKEMISSKKKEEDEITVIPTGGISIGNKIWVSYMSVKKWLEHGRWICGFSSYAYSDNAGTSFKKHSGVKWKEGSNFIQNTFARQSSDIYIWGIPAGRFGGVKLAKVPENSFGTMKSYLYFSGVNPNGNIPLWSNKEQDAIEIISAPVGEISVAWNDYLQKWMIVYLNENKQSIVMRVSDFPWGPWSVEYPLLVGSGRFAGLYGGFIHPRYFENGGQTFYFMMSLWEKYNVFIMKVTLQK